MAPLPGGYGLAVWGRRELFPLFCGRRSVEVHRMTLLVWSEGIDGTKSDPKPSVLFWPVSVSTPSLWPGTERCLLSSKHSQQLLVSF